MSLESTESLKKMTRNVFGYESDSYLVEMTPDIEKAIPRADIN